MRTVRRSARVLVADAADRVLLYRFRLDPYEPAAGTAADLPWASERWFSDAYFFHRVSAHDPDGSGLQAGLELDSHDGFRWWTVPELVATTDSVYPLGLAGLMVDLLAGRLPTEPVHLPWHH